MINSRNVWHALWLAWLVALAMPAAAADAKQVKVVYHLSDGIDQAARTLRNIRNHLDAAPSTKITVVAHGDGIDFLLQDATDKRGNPFDIPVQDLMGKGVDFRVCNNTLVARGIDRAKVLEGATVVPSGVAEVARLQAAEDYVYLRP